MNAAVGVGKMGECPADQLLITRLDYRKHAIDIMEALRELEEFRKQTMSPASEYVCYLGTVVTSTIVFLCAVLNTIPHEGTINVTFDDSAEGDKDVRNLIVGLHRSFFNSIHTYMEEALMKYCLDQKREIPVSMDRRIESLLNELRPKISDKEQNKIAKLKTGRPSSADIANAALSKLSKERRQVWLNFLDGLQVVRNKASHSNPRISEAEASRLSDAGFSALVGDGILTMNTRMYAQVVGHLRSMLDEITSSPT